MSNLVLKPSQTLTVKMTIRLRFNTEDSNSEVFYSFFQRHRTNARFSTSIPSCRTCRTKGILRYVLPGTPNLNEGRPYYVCPRCPREDRWLRWGDNKGINPANPPCACGKPSRQDRIGQGHAIFNLKSGKGFWTCAEGNCGYYSEHLNGDVGKAMDGEGFVPWLLLEGHNGLVIAELPSV